MFVYILRTCDILGNYIKDFEDHHYFTKDDLKKLDFDVHQIHNIANRMAIDKSSNRTIGKISPHKYKEHKISVNQKQLKTYMIPLIDNNMKEITRRKYLSFLRERTDLIIDEIKKVIKKPR